MPRGYLKHNKGFSRKKARGGSSGGSSGSRYGDDNGYGYWDEKKCKNIEGYDDIVIASPNKNPVINHPDHKKKATTDATEKATYPTAECAICFEECPLMCLSQNCRWHDAACHKCLRRIYVRNAQKSIKNYPLRCFHPLCDQKVQAGQLEKHHLFPSPTEGRKHHEMLLLSKIKSTEGMRTVHCPKCLAPRGIRKLEQDCKHNCKNCRTLYRVTPDYATIRALENMQGDSCGENEGWARCPDCSILISKGDGCDDMYCTYCAHEFSWEKAQASFGLLARPPDEEIYLWW